MLHIHCGDPSAESLRRSKAPGEVIVWTELLHEGPTPAGLEGEGWYDARARFLSESTGGALSIQKVKSMLQGQDAALAAFSEHDEVVLWFDHCLFDQTILIRHLDWFSRQVLGKTRLSLICAGEFPGFKHFKGLGELSPDRLASLLDGRHEITSLEIELAGKAWKAFRSPDPRAIEEALLQDASALPYLKNALVRHLEQFPSACNGLNRLENESLDVVAGGESRLGPIFEAVSAREEAPFFGDTFLWRSLDQLAGGRIPLLRVEGPGRLALWEPRSIGRWRILITDAGRLVLAGKEDWIRLNGIDRWLGGVHLKGEDSSWRWDEKSRSLLHT